MAKNNVQSVSYLLCTQVIKPQIIQKPQNQSQVEVSVLTLALMAAASACRNSLVFSGSCPATILAGLAATLCPVATTVGREKKQPP